MVERVKPGGDIPPQTECMIHLFRALLALRKAAHIAEGLPNHGNLYAEIKDASGIIGQSVTFLEAERCVQLGADRQDLEVTA